MDTVTATTAGLPLIRWEQDGAWHTLPWRSLAGVAPPQRVVLADDRMTADIAFRLACGGTALLWQGDFHNARQLLQALARRVDGKSTKGRSKRQGTVDLPPLERFHQYRLAQSQRARILGMLLLPFEAGHHLALRRAPDVALACREAAGEAAQVQVQAYCASLRELLGIIGAHEWRKAGVPVPALGGAARIYPHYGVFSPVRGEYLELVARAPLPSALRHCPVALDIGTGTGVLAALLAQRGVAQVMAVDQDSRALACAQENIDRLGWQAVVSIVAADLFPPQPDCGRVALAVCNPPWLPGRPATPLEHAIYDADSRMLRGFLQGLAAHLVPGGEGWLILSDLAEHLGLRSREQLLAWIEAAGLRVIGRDDIWPHHPRTRDTTDPLHAARAAELTSLWRLAVIVKPSGLG